MLRLVIGSPLLRVDGWVGVGVFGTVRKEPPLLPPRFERNVGPFWTPPEIGAEMFVVGPGLQNVVEN